MTLASTLALGPLACGRPAPAPAVAPAPAPAPAPARLGPVVPAAALREDVALLRRALTELHPGLTRYRTRAELEAVFAALARELDGDRAQSEVLLAVTRALAQLQCGHTFVNPNNQSDAVRAALIDATDRLPVHLRWDDRRLIVTASFTPALAPGDELRAIDGVASGDLLDRLLPLARGDGGNLAARRHDLAVDGGEDTSTFDLYLPLLRPPRGGARTLAVRGPDGADRTVRVPLARTRPRAVTPDRRSDQPLWTLEAIAPDTALLRMPTWSVYDSQWDWQAWLDASFDQLAARPPRTLIVDLRGNAGGTTGVVDALLARLPPSPPRDPGLRRVRMRTVPDDLRPHLSTWDPSFFDWTGEIERGPDADGLFELRTPAPAPVPARPRYPGRVRVLVDGAASSATFLFADHVQRHRVATLVGAPTGGNQRGITGGALFFLRLPGSGLTVDLPLIAQTPREPRPDAGLTPDVVVPPGDDALAVARRLP